MHSLELEKRQKRITLFCWLFLIAGLILKLVYASQVSFDYSTHDLGGLLKPDYNGHLNYIIYLFQNKHFQVLHPNQLYHPPLFHIIGAIVLWCYGGMERWTEAMEMLQYINMCFSSLSVFYCYRILNNRVKNNFYLVVGTAFLSFCPIFYIIGGELNNDCLVTLFEVMTIYYTLTWINNHNLLNIIRIALCIGFGMFTKSSMATIAVPVGILFVYYFISDRIKWKMYLKQYLCFSLFCVPLGLFWSVRRYIYERLPLLYVLKPKGTRQYIGDVSWLERIGLPNVKELFCLKIDFDDSHSYTNIWGQTMITMNYDEGILRIDSLWAQKIAIASMWLSVVLFITLMTVSIYGLFIRKINFCDKMLFPVYFLVIFGSYIKMCFDFPYVCTMNSRYIAIVQLLLITGYGLVKDRISIPKIIDYSVAVLVALICISQSFLYLVYAV